MESIVRERLDADFFFLAREKGEELFPSSLAPLLRYYESVLAPVEQRLAASSYQTTNVKEVKLSEPFDGSAPFPCGPLFLQVVYVENIGLPREERHREVLRSRGGVAAAPTVTSREHPAADGGDEDAGAVVDATLQACEAVGEHQRGGPSRGGGAHRCLKLLLTDGHRCLWGIERRSAGPPLLPGGVVIGGKLMIRIGDSRTPHTVAPAELLQHGVLRLEGRYTESLGGGVEGLQVYWEEVARSYLAQRTGRPSRRLEADTAAPPEDRVVMTRENVGRAAPMNEPSSSPPVATAVIAIEDEVETGLAQWMREMKHFPWGMVGQGSAAPPEPPPRCFFTRAFICDVQSDLHFEPGGGGEGCGYALEVRLADASVSGESPPEEGGGWDLQGGTLVATLGNEVLQDMLGGVPAGAFEALSVLLDRIEAFNAATLAGGEPIEVLAETVMAEQGAFLSQFSAFLGNLFPPCPTLQGGLSLDLVRGFYRDQAVRVRGWLEAAIQRLGELLEGLGTRWFGITYEPPPFLVCGGPSLTMRSNPNTYSVKSRALEESRAPRSGPEGEALVELGKVRVTEIRALT